MNSFHNGDILSNNFVLLKDKLKNQNLTLLQDYTFVCKSEPTSNWLSTNNIKALNIPAKCPAIF